MMTMSQCNVWPTCDTEVIEFELACRSESTKDVTKKLLIESRHQPYV